MLLADLYYYQVLIYKLLSLKCQGGQLGLDLQVAFVEKRPDLGLFEVKQVSSQEFILLTGLFQGLSLHLSHRFFECGVTRRRLRP